MLCERTKVLLHEGGSGGSRGYNLRHFIRKLCLSECFCSFVVGHLSKVALVGLGLALSFGYLDMGCRRDEVRTSHMNTHEHTHTHTHTPVQPSSDVSLAGTPMDGGMKLQVQPLSPENEL